MSVETKNIKETTTVKPGGKIVQAKKTVVAPTFNPQEKQAFDDQDFADFSAIGSGNSGTPNYMNDVAKTINRYYNFNGAQKYSGNQQPLSENVGNDVSKVPYREKMLQSMSQRALGIARQMGVKNATEFKANADLIMSRAGGEDYKILKENNLMYNLPDALGRLYEDKLKTYKSSRDRYDYNPTTGKLELKGPKVIPTAAESSTERMIKGAVEEAKSSTIPSKESKTIKLKVSNK
jgi:hypothetical protein